MSLENALDQCTQALNALTAILLEQPRPNQEVVANQTGSPRGVKKKSAPDQGMTPAPTSSAIADPYTNAATAITELSRIKGREAALKVLAAFDATKLPGVAQDRLADVAIAARQALEAQE